MVIPEGMPGNSTTSLERQPAALLCGFRLVPRLRAALLEVGDEISLQDLQKYLNGENTSEPLVSIAKTKYERESLLLAYSRFMTAVEDGLRMGRARSEKLAWIVGHSRLTPAMEIDSRTIDRISELGLSAQVGSDYQSWLPWMSLGIVNLFRRWRQPRIRTIRRAMFKLSAGSEADFPWEPGYATWKRHLPMQALYRHEPSRLLDEALAALSSLGLTSINDLRCCHPDAVHASKAQARPLFTLYRLLDQDGLSA